MQPIHDLAKATIDYPDIKLSYETVSHKKVSVNEVPVNEVPVNENKIVELRDRYSSPLSVFYLEFGK